MPGYILDHQAPVAGGFPGLLTLGEDFGDDPGGGDPMPDPSEWAPHAYNALRQIQAHLDVARYVYRETNPDAAWTWAGEAARIAQETADAYVKTAAAGR